MGNEKLKQTVAAMALASAPLLQAVPTADSDGLPRFAPKGRPRGRCHDMKKKRKRRMVKESRRRNR